MALSIFYKVKNNHWVHASFFNNDQGKKSNMEQIVIQISNKEKAQLLYQLLSALDFVNSITKVEVDIPVSNVSLTETPKDFFSFAGLWANRQDIDIHSIRHQAMSKSDIVERTIS